LKHVLSLLVVVLLGAWAVAEPPTVERTGRIPLANAQKAIQYHQKNGDEYGNARDPPIFRVFINFYPNRYGRCGQKNKQYWVLEAFNPQYEKTGHR
jgi:hypothetical protein